MIKKIGKILFVSILTIGIVYTSSLVYKQNFEKINTEKKDYLTQSLSADESNMIILNKVKELQQYAESYRTENSISTSATELCLQYIRKDRYNTTAWSTFAGTIDQNFVTYVQNKNSSLSFPKTDLLIDEQTMKEIDFVHMIAVLNAYYKNGDMVALIISTHYAGWAGDLMTLLKEVVNYRINNNITDTTLLTEFANHRLGTNASSTFDSLDALADLDAININNNSTLKSDLYTTLVNYYINNDDTTANNSYNRFKNVQTKLGNQATIKNTAKNLVSSSTIQEMLISDVKENITSTDTEIVSQVFAEYVYQKPYVYMTSTKGTIKIGDEINIPLIEKHMNDATLTYDSKIATANISKSTINVTALDYGTTTITITSKDSTETATYNLTVTNIAPEITTNLTLKEELEVGNAKKITIKATGTNNIYTWYLTDTENSKDTILEVTNVPSIMLEPTIDMNNKYLKCGIKNEGNTEILTSAVQLKVTDPTIVEDKDKTNNETTEDNTTDEDTSDNTTNDNETTSDKTYDFYEGENQKIDNTSKVFKVRINADISLFDKVYINDELVDSSNYKVIEGSTIIEFNQEYIKKLKTGDYSLKVTFTDGKTATTNFSITNTIINKLNPYTATLHTYKELVLGILISGAALIAVKSKKKQYNKNI